MKLDGGEAKQLGSLSWNVGIDKRVGKTGKKRVNYFWLIGTMMFQFIREEMQL